MEIFHNNGNPWKSSQWFFLTSRNFFIIHCYCVFYLTLYFLTASSIRDRITVSIARSHFLIFLHKFYSNHQCRQGLVYAKRIRLTEIVGNNHSMISGEISLKNINSLLIKNIRYKFEWVITFNLEIIFSLISDVIFPFVSHSLRMYSLNATVSNTFIGTPWVNLPFNFTSSGHNVWPRTYIGFFPRRVAHKFCRSSWCNWTPCNKNITDQIILFYTVEFCVEGGLPLMQYWLEIPLLRFSWLIHFWVFWWFQGKGGERGRGAEVDRFV